MAEEKEYKIVIARPAQIRYQQRVLPYIYENFSFERAIEVDENILATVYITDFFPTKMNPQRISHQDPGISRSKSSGMGGVGCKRTPAMERCCVYVIKIH